MGVLIIVARTSSAAPGGNAQSGDWIGSWAAAVTAAEPSGLSQVGLSNQTYRMGVHLSVGGDQIRIRLTNIYGTQTLTVGHATIAKSNSGTPQVSDIDPSTLRELTFNGKPTTAILKGAELYSDPVDLSVDEGADLIVTGGLPHSDRPRHVARAQRAKLLLWPGDLADSTDGPWNARRDCCWLFLSAVDVLRHQPNGAIAVLGDSISDGTGATLNTKGAGPICSQSGCSPRAANRTTRVC